MKITLATMLWAPNQNSYSFSRMYDESWVDKLYRGWKRNLTVPFDFIAWTDTEREFDEPEIKQLPLTGLPTYGHCIQPFETGLPTIITGLDTMIIGNCDHFAEWCLEERPHIGLPRNPDKATEACNAITLIPPGFGDVWRNWKGENDMVYSRKQPHVFIDDFWPRQVVSYKRHVKKHGLGDARIVYFHGEEKPHQLDLDWVRENWR